MRTIRILLTIFLLAPLPAFAQIVHIPDPSLNAIIRETIDLPDHIPLTLHTIQQLTHLDAAYLQIQDISGLEYATNLVSLSLAGNDVSDIAPLAKLPITELRLWGNKVSDLAPLANLTTLTVLDVGDCRISDISPLANLIQLEWLEIRRNQISDISPLANLTQLTYLDAHNNQIADVRPLTSLPRLEVLKIAKNLIVDHSPLDVLPLTHFEYDETCDMPPLPLEPRLDNRTFPSVFSAWGGVSWSYVLNQPHLSGLEQMAQHDLYWCCLLWGYSFYRNGDTVELRGWQERATSNRDAYIALNSNMVILAAIGAVWEEYGEFPEDSPYWLRDEHGEILPAWDSSGLMNLNHPYVQKRIIDRAVAVSQCGLYDGIFFDGWSEYHNGRRGALPGMETILKGIRERVREDFLIMVNTNTRIAPVSAPYINGLFLESGFPGDSNSPEDLEERLSELEDTLRWAETTLRSPQINGLEGWGFANESPDSPLNLHWMRVVTTLSLTFTNGYVLYNNGESHRHYWYAFWDADLGQPVGEKAQVYEGRDGLYIREYTNGWAVYNHSGKPQIITLPEKAQGVASGWLNTKHALPNLDGEMYLRVKPKNPADVNRDGIVNILDLTLIAQAFGTDSRNADINADGVVNVFDLVIVAKQF